MSSLAALSLDDLPILVTANGTLIQPPSHVEQAGALLPGSFNPVHAGHWQLAAVAERRLGAATVFELSIDHVDKPNLSLDEVRRRLAQFTGRAGVWVTRAPRFTEKVALFPQRTFAVGVDVALRLVEPRYYDDNQDRMLEALATLERHGCRVLVAPRVDANGRLLTLDDVPLPAEYRPMFTAISPDVFRHDISSTALRSQHTGSIGECNED
jgi:hypothetical protein